MLCWPLLLLHVRPPDLLPQFFLPAQLCLLNFHGFPHLRQPYLHFPLEPQMQCLLRWWVYMQLLPFRKLLHVRHLPVSLCHFYYPPLLPLEQVPSAFSLLLYQDSLRSHLPHRHSNRQQEVLAFLLLFLSSRCHLLSSLQAHRSFPAASLLRQQFCFSEKENNFDIFAISISFSLK